MYGLEKMNNNSIKPLGTETDFTKSNFARECGWSHVSIKQITSWKSFKSYTKYKEVPKFQINAEFRWQKIDKNVNNK